MNNKQKLVLKIVGGIFVLMLLFPPYQYTNSKGKFVRETGYGFILSTPGNHETVNYKKLFMQLGVMASVGAVGLFLRKDSISG